MTFINTWTCPKCGSEYVSNRPKPKPTSCAKCQNAEFHRLMDAKPHDVDSQAWIDQHKSILHQY